jgi:hypothetical protein
MIEALSGPAVGAGIVWAFIVADVVCVSEDLLR